MDDPNIIMEEYIRLEEEKSRRRAIFYNDALTSEVALSCEPTVSPLNKNQINFRILFDESDDEDYTVKMNDPNITMEEYIRLEEEKSRRRGKVYNWETAMYGKICVISSQHAVIPVIDDEDGINLMEEAQLQAQNTSIYQLKEHIKSIKENNKEEKVKQEMDEIETINIELEHSVAKLLSENELLHKEIEHLKKIYKDQFDSIKKTRALSKEHSDYLISQLNSTSMENADLKGQIQEKIFVTTALQNELKRLKGKNMLDNATTITNATTIAPGMFKLDLDPLAPRITSTKVVPLKETTPHSVETQKPELKVYSRKPKQVKSVGCPYCSLVFGTPVLHNIWTGNALSHRALDITGFQLDNSMTQILKLIFGKTLVLFGNLEGVDLLSGSRDTNLYTIYLDDMLKTSLICLLSKASKTKSWLWHSRLSQLNFGKSKKSSHQPKAEDTNQEKLYLLHMDLCGPMRMESINRKKNILVIVDDYSRFTWVKFLRPKYEAPNAIIKCIKNIQVRTVRNVQTDNGTEFVNKTLCDFYENIGISHQTSVAHTPQLYGIVKRRNQNLMEAAHTMLIFSKAHMFLWAKAIYTACYT
ncbi:retrovirus-related pol polyprotein from transposon TNT 1-94 [Tanacetum coccineum]